jgi:hypothetical protein
MKTMKTMLATIMMCAAAALIAMGGSVPMAVHGDDAAGHQSQTATQQPEILPAVAIDSVTLDRIFR